MALLSLTTQSWRSRAWSSLWLLFQGSSKKGVPFFWVRLTHVHSYYFVSHHHTRSFPRLPLALTTSLGLESTFSVPNKLRFLKAEILWFSLSILLLPCQTLYAIAQQVGDNSMLLLEWTPVLLLGFWDDKWPQSASECLRVNWGRGDQDMAISGIWESQGFK